MKHTSAKGGNAPEIAATVSEEYHIDAAAQKPHEGLVRNVHIAEDDNLGEFVGEKGMMDGIILPDQKMPPLLHDLRSLGFDIYDHG